MTYEEIKEMLNILNRLPKSERVKIMYMIKGAQMFGELKIK